MPDTATAPEPIFTAEEGLEELWVKAYQGEVLGELLFGGIAEQLADPDQAAKMRVVATLERRTKEATAPALERAGVSTEPDPEMQVMATVLIPGALAMTWSDLMATIGPITEQYIPLYQRIGELSPAERETADLLVAHEVALRDVRRAPKSPGIGPARSAHHGAGPHGLTSPWGPHPAGRREADPPLGTRGPTPPSMVGLAMAPVVHFRAAVALAGRFPALAGVDLSLDQGEVVVVVGANGAGKTSLLRACAGLLPVTSGEATVLGVDLTTDHTSVRRYVGLLGHAAPLYDELSAAENVQFAVRALGLPVPSAPTRRSSVSA